MSSLYFVLTHPKALLRLKNNFSKNNDIVEDNNDYAELFSIGVSPKAQSKGLGKLLLLETERILKNSEVNRLSLTTDFHDNEQAIQFYKSQGYDILYEFVAYPDRRMYRMIKQLSQ